MLMVFTGPVFRSLKGSFSRLMTGVGERADVPDCASDQKSEKGFL